MKSKLKILISIGDALFCFLNNNGKSKIPRAGPRLQVMNFDWTGFEEFR